MKLINAGVDYLYPKIHGEEFLQIIEIIGRTCYKSEKNITDESAYKFGKNLIFNEHEAMLEHAPSISMRFTCDRGVSHEIVRHRLFSFAQESTRYCNYGNNDDGVTFIIPCWIKEDLHNRVFNPTWYGCLGDHAIDPFVDGSPESWWFWSCATSELHYLKLLKKGWSPQQARSTLTNSLKTEVVVTGNVREWRHFFKLRTAKAAHPQMREVAIRAFDILNNSIPVIFEDIHPYRELF